MTDKEKEFEDFVEKGSIRLMSKIELRKHVADVIRKSGLTISEYAETCLMDKARNPKSVLDEIQMIDEESYHGCATFKFDQQINALWSLFTQLEYLFQSAVNALTSNQREALSDCIQASRKEFLFGTLTCLRGHSTDAENYMRKAIEFCAFGVKIIRTPRHAAIWLEAVQSKNKYDRYKSEFKIMQVLKELDSTGIELRKLYEENCKSVHASPYAIKTQSRIIQTSEGRINYLPYHEDSNAEDRKSLIERALTQCKCYFFIVLVFGHSIKVSVKGITSTNWDLEVEKCEKILEVESKRIRELLRSNQ